MASTERAEYLRSEISRLEGAIAHLSDKGAEIYNKRFPLAFEDCPETIARRQREKHPPEIYEKKGEDFLAEFKEKLCKYKAEFAEIERKDSD